MPTNAEQLATIKEQTLAIIVTITASPKPSYSIGDHTVSWGEYLKQLKETVAFTDAQLASIVPYEIHSQGFT